MEQVGMIFSLNLLPVLQVCCFYFVLTVFTTVGFGEGLQLVFLLSHCPFELKLVPSTDSSKSIFCWLIFTYCFDSSFGLDSACR